MTVESLYSPQKGGDVSTIADEAGAGDIGSFPFFPGYELLEIVGQGGMGVVYKARNTRLGRVVALKTITELEPGNSNQFARFLGEARAAARLQHPNIVPIHEIGEHEGRPYFVQEFVDGGDLKKQLADKPMAVRRSAALLETLARAVLAAHKAGIVHRDLKPSNILLTTEGVPKVADFGLAKLLGGDSGRAQSGQVVGTPSYMAPEQAEGRSKEVGPVADVFALGAILYEALTGRPPFLGDSQIETLRLVSSSDPVSPERLRPDIPRDLATICLKCLEKSPATRYATALDLAEDLGRFRRGEPVHARRIGPLRRSCKWAIRHPWQTTSAAFLMIGVSAFIGFMYWHTLELRAKEAKVRRNYQEARSAIRAMLGRLDDRRLSGTPRLLEICSGAREDALAFYDRVLSDVDLTDPAVRADTARALNEASILQTALGRHDQGRESARRALQLADGLRSDGPDTVEYMELRLECLSTLGPRIDLSNRPDDGLSACREAVDLARRLVAVRPDDARLRERFATAHTHLGNAFHSLNGADRYNLATYWALSADSVRKDQSVSPAERSRLVNSHIQDAIRWLSSAREAGFFDQPGMRDHAKNDADLEILADRVEFRVIIEPSQAKR